MCLYNKLRQLLGIHNADVGGSNPPVATMIFNDLRRSSGSAFSFAGEMWVTFLPHNPQYGSALGVTGQIERYQPTDFSRWVV